MTDNSPGPGADPASEPVSRDLLARVRALLAKAESTTFEAEADAFTAKAQELMTRYRIDRAVLEAERPGDPGSGSAGPDTRDVPVDAPYAQAKAALLGVVAAANDTRAVWARAEGRSTLIGFAVDLDVTEELFTSLLVQATAAMQREGAKQDRWGRSRTTRFRRSFLVAFAARIGQRLHEAAIAATEAAETEYGPSLVPVLARRSELVDRATEEAFPDLGTFTPTATDREGWHAGTVHADQADLAAGARLAR